MTLLCTISHSETIKAHIVHLFQIYETKKFENIIIKKMNLSTKIKPVHDVHATFLIHKYIHEIM